MISAVPSVEVLNCDASVLANKFTAELGAPEATLTMSSMLMIKEILAIAQNDVTFATIPIANALVITASMFSKVLSR